MGEPPSWIRILQRIEYPKPVSGFLTISVLCGGDQITTIEGLVKPQCQIANQVK